MPNEAPSQETVARLLRVVSGLVDEMNAGKAGNAGNGEPADRSRRVRLGSRLERDLGLDSLARAELLLRLGREFGAPLPDAALAEAETPADLLHFLGLPGAAGVSSDLAALPAPGGFAGVPEHAETLVEVLEWHAEHHPSRTHVLLLGEDGAMQALSYAELLRAARRIAAGLVARGLTAGQAVALMLPTGRDYLSSFFGVLLAGGVPVPIYPPARLAQLEEHLQRHARILANAQAVFMVTVARAKGVATLLRGQVPALAEIVTPEELDGEPMALLYRSQPGDLAFLQYTSGSTGDPKGVMLTHANLLANLRAMGEATGACSEDVFVSWLPLYHDMGLIGAWFGSLYFGMRLVLMSPLAFLARPVRWLAAIAQHRGTLSAAPNFAYELCAGKIGEADSRGLDLSSWRLALNGAEPVSPATLDAFAARFSSNGFRRAALAPVYGLAECSVGLAFPPLGRGPRIDAVRRADFAERKCAVPAAAGEPDALLFPSCGRVLAQHEIRIVDEAGEELPERTVGRLQFRGPSATAGYYRNPQATRGLFRDGWLDSGDYAYSAAGEIYLTGRVKDLIIRGGRNLYPYELEQAVGELPGVRKGCVAVFASPDPLTASERLVVVAETRESDSAARADLRRKINEAAVDAIGLPADEVVLVAPHSVLKTSSGKIRRAACREAYEQGRFARRAAKTPPAWRVNLRLGAAALRSLLAQWARRAARAAFAGWCWLLFVAIGLPVAALVALMRRPAGGRALLHGAARLFFALAGMPVRTSGLDRLPGEPHLLLVNHGSYLDALALCAALPPRFGHLFVAKRELAAQPLTHAILRGLGTLFVERSLAQKSVEDVEALVAALGNGSSLLVFPEGTFSREAGLKPFRMGAFVAATRTGAPVQLAGLRGTRTALRDGSWLPRHGRLELEIGPLLETDGADWGAATRLRERARGEMLKLCGEHDLAR